MSSMTETDQRSEYIAGLRAIADALEQHPDVKLPYHGNTGTFSWVTSHEADPKAETAKIVRTFGGDWTKRENQGDLMVFVGRIAGVSVDIICDRDTVCTRRVVGTEDREVQMVVTPAVTETVTETVEVVEWDCGSLLAPVKAAS